VSNNIIVSLSERRRSAIVVTRRFCCVRPPPYPPSRCSVRRKGIFLPPSLAPAHTAIVRYVPRDFISIFVARTIRSTTDNVARNFRRRAGAYTHTHRIEETVRIFRRRD